MAVERGKEVCTSCWATIDIGVGNCPTCGSPVKYVERLEFIGSSGHKEEEYQEAFITAKPIKAKLSLLPTAILIITIILLGAGITVGKNAITSGITIDDYVGDWQVLNPDQLESYANEVKEKKEIIVSFWKEESGLKCDIPLPGEVAFDSEVEKNLLRGTLNVAFSQDQTAPIAIEISRNKKKMIVYFKIDDLSTKPDTILRLKRIDTP